MLRLFIAVSIVMLAVSCANFTGDKTTMAATTVDDVIYAWNDECVNYSFDLYSPSLTMGEAYQGMAYQVDSAGLMLAIQQHPRVLSSFHNDPNINDILSQVVRAPEWYK